MATDSGPIQGNAVIGQSGGPTAVINASLVGAIKGLRSNDAVGTIFGMRHGVRGLTQDNLADLSDTDDQTLDQLLRTP
ncbi:MAG: phosphofructokinase, partial [Planctomycetota bacterium]